MKRFVRAETLRSHNYDFVNNVIRNDWLGRQSRILLSKNNENCVYVKEEKQATKITHLRIVISLRKIYSDIKMGARPFYWEACK